MLLMVMGVWSLVSIAIAVFVARVCSLTDD